MTRLRTNEKVAATLCVIAALGIVGEIDFAMRRAPKMRPAQARAVSSDATPRPATARTRRRHRPEQGTYRRAAFELRHRFGADIVEINRFDGVVTVGLRAGDGIFVKAGMRGDARDAFREVFRDAGYEPRRVIVQFHGPLVDRATGRESDGIWSVYSISHGDAAEISWAHAYEIDWDLYRTMLRDDV